jgi:signal transduction histidine kinase/DNA-binding response OmpR family regulator
MDILAPFASFFEQMTARQAASFFQHPCYHKSMVRNRERILIVENNTEISSFLTNQALKPLGYQVILETDSTAAIQRAQQEKPDAILANIDLPGLSGKDLLVALHAQGIHVPVIVLAGRGMESKVIQAFRLGATDSLFWPVREAEVVSVVERALNQTRNARERAALADKLHTANLELEQRVRELTALYDVGKAAVSVTDQKVLFEKIVQGALAVTSADIGWCLRRDENSRAYLLVAHQNLPAALAGNLYRPWDDGLSSMVALSGEPLSIHGEPVRRFKITLLGEAVLVVPIKVKREVVGLLEVTRKANAPFTAANQKLLEAIADYASISIVNAQLFRFLEERAQSLQMQAEVARLNAQIQTSLLQETTKGLQQAYQYASEHIRQMLKQKNQLNLEQVERLRSTSQSLEQIGGLVNILPAPADIKSEPTRVNLARLLQEALSRFQKIAQQSRVLLKAQLPQSRLDVKGYEHQLRAAIDGLISNAIKYSLQDGEVVVRAAITPDATVHVQVEDHGIGISSDENRVFSGKGRSDALTPEQFGGAAISLPIIKAIVESGGGKIWFESNLGRGTTFHFTLPLDK